LPQDIALPRVAGSPPVDATPEQRIVAGLFFDASPGKARADARPAGMHRVVQSIRLRIRYAVADPARRVRIQRECSLQETNSAMGALLEKLAAARAAVRHPAQLRASLRRLSHAVAAAEQYETAGLVLRAVARAHTGQLDIEALFALRTGPLRTDPNDREKLLAGIADGDRSDARHTLQTIRQAVDDACVCHAVQAPLDALLQHSSIRGRVIQQQVTQIEHQLGRLRERMNLLLDTHAAVRADLAQDDVQHTLRKRFLAPAIARLKTNDLMRLQDTLEKHAATPPQFGSQSLSRAFAVRAPGQERASTLLDEFDEDIDDGPQDVAPGFNRGAADVVYDTPHENIYQTVARERPVSMSGSLMRSSGRAGGLVQRSRTVSFLGTSAAAFARAPVESAELEETAWALRDALATEMALRRPG
jgi:hypothetical protein